MNTTQALVTLMALLAANLIYADQQQTNTTMACTHFPPYKIESSSKTIEHSGIDIDVIRAALDAVSRKVEFDFYPWKRTVQMTKQAEVDALCGCAYRPEREQHFIYSDMLGQHSQGIFTHEEPKLKKITSLDDLSGYRVAAVRGYAVHLELKKRKNIETIEANDDHHLLRLLLAKRVDAIYSYRDIIRYRMTSHSNHQSIHYQELNSQPYYLCFSRYKENIRQAVNEFNKGLRIIRFNGRYEKIWRNYR